MALELRSEQRIILAWSPTKMWSPDEKVRGTQNGKMWSATFDILFDL